MNLRSGFLFTTLVALAACGGTVDTRSTSRGVETDAGGNENGGARGGTAGVRLSTGGFRQMGGLPGIAGTGPAGAAGALVGSCNPNFCQPAPNAAACCVTVNGPCGVNYGAGCVSRGVSMPPAVPTCTDGLLNGAETDVDCGGPACPPCTPGLACFVDADCVDHWCVAGVCGLSGFDAGTAPGCDGSACTPVIDATPSPPEASPVPTCTDRVKNGAETDVDCGGPACIPCRVGNACNVADDCVSRTCFGNHVCGTAECTDAMHNGLESDVDCGGSCARCPPGKSCNTFADCTSSVCAGGVCFAPSCADGVRNGNEVCVDCGGSCPPCSNCPADAD